MALVTSWSPFFKSGSRMRGRALQLAEAITRVEVEDDEFVRAEVVDEELAAQAGGDTGVGGDAGEDAGTQTVVIRPGEQPKSVCAECTCERFATGQYCEHIWATLLAVQDGMEGPSDSENPGVKAKELEGKRVKAPKAGKRDLTRKKRVKEPDWIGRLSMLRPPSVEIDAASTGHLPSQRQILYVVLPQLSARHGVLLIEIRQRTPGVTGWSRSKPIRLSQSTIATLSDPADRELCATIMGGQGISDAASDEIYRNDRSHSLYRLPLGARRKMLKQIIKTGRCYVDIAEEGAAPNEVPLLWSGDEPWELWMVGTQDDEALRINVELRREQIAGSLSSGKLLKQENAEQKKADPKDGEEATPDKPATNTRHLPIHRPELILGSHDGILIHLAKDKALAASFDDRDAFRWVNQFRDWSQSHGEARPIDVPLADVKRFLERLYLLPQLPEIDLPAGLGPSELRVDPIATLEIFSAGSNQANEVLPGSAKNQLLAQSWFVYGDQRVNPAQPGRFVSMTSEDFDAAKEGSEESETEEATEEIVTAESPTEIDAATDAPADETQSADVNSNGYNTLAAMADEGTARRLVRRQHSKEAEGVALLSTLGLRQLPSSTSGGNSMALNQRQVGPTIARLIVEGWRVMADQKVVRNPGTPSLAITSGVDWFELRGSVKFQRDDGEEQEIALPEILAAAREGRQMIELGDGSQGLLPDHWLEEHGMLTTLGELEDDHLRFKSSQAAMLDALIDDQLTMMEFDEKFQATRERLREFDGVHAIEAPDNFEGTLREYQAEGLGWLSFLRWFGVGGILADDMGLGKTIQVLAMIQSRVNEMREAQAKDPKAKFRPTLIAAPRSVVFNWLDEAAKFTPELKVLTYAGTEREELRKQFADHNIIVTSYGLMRRDIDHLREIDFDYIVLDEAQAIKNPASQSAKSARLLESQHRLALTGTPVENHLGDLWSIFEFLNPGMLGSQLRFAELVRASQGSNANPMAANDTTGEQKARIVEQIAKSLRPFILRRTKTEVLKDLPLKTEQTIVCDMEDAQREMYDQLRMYYRSNLVTQLEQSPSDELDPDLMVPSDVDLDFAEAPVAALQEKTAAPTGSKSALGKSAFMVLEALLRLRQASCHPGLIDDKRLEEPSAKLETLFDMLEEVTAEGGKALIFSQFTSMLSIVRKRMESIGMNYCYLDGQTRDRRGVVDQFQTDDDIPAFLISLKAGGFGLNLTRAEYVFILDPWWNPAVEAQAIDRAHRIGQTRPVFAYRLVCRDTVEQHILALQDRKRELANAIVGGEGNLLRDLTREDLDRLLS